MLSIGCPFHEEVTLTLTEDLPAGTELVVTPIELRGSKMVRIAFEAPLSVQIVRDGAKSKDRKVREELHDTIKEPEQAKDVN